MNLLATRTFAAGLSAGLFSTLAFAAEPVAITSAAANAPKVVWQIGKEDQDYAEFAIAGQYKNYQINFLQPTILYEIGKSNPARDWPYIQPGTADRWAGGRVRPRTIRFTLADEPHGVFILRIVMLDVSPSKPSVLTVAIKGHEGRFSFNPGASADSLTNSKVGGKPQVVEARLPAFLFGQGVNELTLSTDGEGSWLIYDAITLLNDENRPSPATITRLAAKATPIYVKRDGALNRIIGVDLSMDNYATLPSLRAVINGGSPRDIPLLDPPLFGTAHADLAIADSDKPQSITITASLGAQTRTTELSVDPGRKWIIYIVPASHTDVGYTDIQAKTIEGHNQDTDKAIELAKQYPDYRWNLEVAMQAETFLDTRSGLQREDFLRLAREGHIGVSASYANMLTGILSSDGACRLFQYAADLQRLYGIPHKWAMVSDVPSMEASYPMIAADSGVRYLAQGINNDHAANIKLYNNSPCWWEGPDGSRVLVAFSKAYGLARSWGVCDSMSRTKTEVASKLIEFEKRADYPYDAVFVHGEEGDNTRLNPHMAEVVKQWNESYVYPKIVLSSGPDFFEHIENNYGDKLPVIKGSGGTYWEDGAGSSAKETAMDRHSQEKLGTAECLLALSQRIKPGNYPQQEIDSAWRNCLLYDEHTWGAAGSISSPDAPGTLAQWKIKSQFAVDAEKQSGELLDRGLQSFATRIRTSQSSLVVFNPSGWNRSEIISVKLPKGLTITEPGVTTCETESNIYAWVENVPSCGYRVLKLGAATSQPTLQPAAGNALESKFYRVSFDPATGGISSIFDRESKRELVDSKSPYQLNQYLYVAGAKAGMEMTRRGHDDFTISTPQNITLKKLTLGQLGEMMLIESSATMTPKISTTVIVWNNTKRIDIDDQLEKQPTCSLEAGYFAFPFAVENPTFRYEIPMGIVNANTDMLPGACLNWFTVQHFTEVSGKNGAVVWATPDAPLVCFQDIIRDQWKVKLPMVNGHIYSYLFNNYWHTNYKAKQGGGLDFRFAITSRAASDSSASARFGADVSSPLPSVIVGANPDGLLSARTGSLLSIAEPNAQLIEVRQANDGTNTIARLWETSGKETVAHLDVKTLGVKKASACNLVEEGAAALELKDGVVAIPLRAHGVATVRLE